MNIHQRFHQMCMISIAEMGAKALGCLWCFPESNWCCLAVQHLGFFANPLKSHNCWEMRWLKSPEHKVVMADEAKKILVFIRSGRGTKLGFMLNVDNVDTRVLVSVLVVPDLFFCQLDWARLINQCTNFFSCKPRLHFCHQLSSMRRAERPTNRPAKGYRSLSGGGDCFGHWGGIREWIGVAPK